MPEPELHGKVSLVQVAVPSRENIEDYQQLTDKVNRLVGEINGKFGTAHWVPVVYMHRGIPRAELVALVDAVVDAREEVGSVETRGHDARLDELSRIIHSA